MSSSPPGVRFHFLILCALLDQTLAKERIHTIAIHCKIRLFLFPVCIRVCVPTCFDEYTTSMLMKEAAHFINNRFSHCSGSKRECFFYFYRFYFSICTKWNKISFNYVKTNSDSLLFAFFCINFNAFLIPPHWLVNQPLQLLLLYNAFQSFLINPGFKMAYHYLCKLLEMILSLNCWVLQHSS